jgi:hypothetical protein
MSSEHRGDFLFARSVLAPDSYLFAVGLPEQ